MEICAIVRQGGVVMVEVGDVAPDFTLRGHAGEDITLSQYLGQNHVVLSFHAASFTGG